MVVLRHDVVHLRLHLQTGPSRLLVAELLLQLPHQHGLFLQREVGVFSVSFGLRLGRAWVRLPVFSFSLNLGLVFYVFTCAVLGRLGMQLWNGFGQVNAGRQSTADFDRVRATLTHFELRINSLHT